MDYHLISSTCWSSIVLAREIYIYIYISHGVKFNGHHVEEALHLASDWLDQLIIDEASGS